jgi:hypothetical protein
VARWPDCSSWRPVAWGVISAARRESQQVLDSCRGGSGRCNAGQAGRRWGGSRRQSDRCCIGVGCGTRLGSGAVPSPRRAYRHADARDRAAFRDVDAIADAWFARARLHLLALPEAGLTDQSLDSRIATACERWLDFLAPHRRVAAEILRGKLWPTHLHHWVPLVFNLSRLVHDMLDTARVPGEGTLRAFQEVGLTFVLLVTLGDWARDRSKAQAWTKRRLHRRLARAGRAAACLARNRYAESPRQA